MITYQIWYAKTDGTRLRLIEDLKQFEYVLVLGDVGIWTGVTPLGAQQYVTGNPDQRILVYRKPEGGNFALEGAFFTSALHTSVEDTGAQLATITAQCANHLLARYIIAYKAGTSEASKTDYADDLMKEIVTENLLSDEDYSGTSLTPARDLSDYVSVAGDLSNGPSITRAFAYRNVLAVLQDIQLQSREEGTEVFYAMKPSGNAFVFTTTTGQPGRDRTVSSSTNPIVFSPENGSVGNWQEGLDYSSEANYIYAGGRGVGEDRNIQTAYDSSRTGASAIARRERFVSATQETTDASVQAAADSALREYRVSKRVYGTLLDTAKTPYGGASGWELGDKVTVVSNGVARDAIIKAVHVKVSARSERIEGRAEYV